jgi:hypothetical protein
VTESRTQSAITTLVQLSLITTLMTLMGCTTTQVITANSKPPVQLQTVISDAERVDVMIMPFAPNLETLPDAGSDDIPVSAEVRRAESRYLAFHLKDTLERTGNWGIVRVVPSAARHHPLLVSGEILASDGERLAVSVTATDASGRVWLTQTYEDNASKYAYQSIKEDPFQDLYNNIANDLVQQYQARAVSEIGNIKQIAQLAFAADLAPDAFSGYLIENKDGTTSVAQAPADRDTILQRVGKIRAQDDLLVDTLDDYYFKFYRDVKPSYDEWRYATYDEAVRLRQLNKQARNRLLTGAALIAGGIYAGSQSNTWAADAAAAGAVVGGIAAVKSGLDRRKQTEIHEQALRELTQSLGREITPSVLDIEGATVELTGSAEQQYAQWRSMLRALYQAERGVAQEPLTPQVR